MSEFADGREKVDDETFWRILAECHGLFGVAARKISEELGESYSRQAVRSRANNRPELLSSIESTAGDMMEAVVHDTAHAAGDPALRYRAAMEWLKTKGKNRGYTTRQEITGAEGLPQSIEIISKSGMEPVTAEEDIDQSIYPDVD